MPETPPRETSRNVYVFGGTSFLNDTASEMAYWILPGFLASLGAGPAQLGVIEGIAESVASFAKLYSGYVTDRVRRRKPLVVFGYALANVMKPVLAVATAWWHVLFIRFADRLAKGVRGAPRDVMLAESVARERVGSAFGLLQAMDSAGAIVGPLAAVMLMAHYGFSMRGVFWAAAAPGLLSIVLVLALARETGRAAHEHHDQQPRAPVPLPRRFYVVLAAIGLFSLGNSSDMFLILRSQDVGIAPALAPMLGLVFNAVYTAGSWPAGKLSDRASRRGAMGRHMIAAAGYAVFAAVYFTFAAAPSRAAIWAAMAFYGLYYALTQPVLKALVSESVPGEARGRAFGMFYFVTSITALLASVITGLLWKQFGAGLPFTVSAALALAAAAMLLAAGMRSRAAA